MSLPVSGWLCSLELWGGWPLAFYLFGGLGILWYAFWLIFIYDTPAQHTSIDPSEKAYIEASVEKKDEVGITLDTIRRKLPILNVNSTFLARKQSESFVFFFRRNSARLPPEWLTDLA